MKPFRTVRRGHTSTIYPASKGFPIRPARTTRDMMMPGHDGMDDARPLPRQSRFRSILTCCSICTGVVGFHPIMLKEPVGAPEPRREWTLCKECHDALLVEMQRSTLRSPIRLRVAMGLVAAERSPVVYTVNRPVHESQAFQREFVWGIRFVILIALLHLVLFAIVFAVPR